MILQRIVRLADWAHRMTLWQRVLVAALPSALGTMAAQWHQSCVFLRLDDPQSICVFDYFWYPPVMDVAFAVLVLAPFLGRARLWVLRIVGLVALSVFVHFAAANLTVGLRGTIELAGIDSIFLNVIPIAVAASLLVAVCASWLTACVARLRLWGLAAGAGLLAALVFLLPDLFRFDPAYLRHFGTELVWPVWHMAMAVALYGGLRAGE